MSLFSLVRYILRHPLNRGGKAAALGRFARWQVASRLIGRPVALPFVGGTSLLTERGMTGATGNWYCGLHEASEMGFVLHMLRPGDLFVDIGANVGSYSVLAAGACKARVIAVEPLPATFARLKANLRLNDLTEVEAHCCGLSSAPGELRFTSGLDTMNRIALPGDSVATVSVPVTTLDSLCAGRSPTMAKIDVEGHELAVLDGGGATLSAPTLQAVLMETNGSGEKFGVADSVLIDRMAGFGLTPHGYDPFERRLQPYRAGVDNNAIFVRDAAAAAARLRDAPYHAIVNGRI